jgi:predicted membrane metal-binding protein
VVALLILAAVAFAVLQFSHPDRPWTGALVMTAAALAVATPHYQWYSLLLVMLVALDGRPEWLAFAAGGYYSAYPALGARYFLPSRLHDAVAYGVPLVVVGAGWLIRNELAKRAALAAEPAAPEPVATEPVATDRVATDRVATDRVATDRVVAEPVAAEPVPAEEVPV